MVVRVLVSTCPSVKDKMLTRQFNPIVWASDNMETVARYYEGAVVEMLVELCEGNEMPYVRDSSELQVPVSTYTYGVAEMKCPRGATWYSFSRGYLLSYARCIREVHPDLSALLEEE